MRTAKGLLNKPTDPHLALLEYRNTPIANGFSPPQLLMNCQLRTDSQGALVL